MINNTLYRPKLESGRNATLWSPMSVYTSSLIKQTSDSILLEVEKVVDDYATKSDLEVTASAITATVNELERTVSGNTENIGRLQVTAREISAGVSALTESVSGNTERIGRLEVTASGISQTVSAHTQSISGNTVQIGQLNVRAGLIEGRVEEIENGGVVPNLLPQNGWMDKDETFINPTDDMCYSASTSSILSPKIHLGTGTYCISNYNNAGNRFDCYYMGVTQSSPSKAPEQTTKQPISIEWDGGSLSVTHYENNRNTVATNYNNPFYEEYDANNPIWYCTFPSNVTTISKLQYQPQQGAASMFLSCSNLTTVNTDNFDLSQVQTMYQFMYGCSSLQEIDLSNAGLSNKCTTMYYAFLGCGALTKANLAGFDTSNVTDMNGLFNNDRNITEIDLSGWSFDKVTSYGNMFRNCNSLTKIYMKGCSDSAVQFIQARLAECTTSTYPYTALSTLVTIDTENRMDSSQSSPAKASEQPHKITLTPTIVSSTTESYNDCSRLYSVFNIESENDYYFEYGNESTDSLFYKPKLELGSVPTVYESGYISYSSLIEQTAHQISLKVEEEVTDGTETRLKRAGLDITSDTVKVEADKFEVYNSQGTLAMGTDANANFRVGGFKLKGDAITNEGFNNDAYIVCRNDNHNTFAGMGGNVLPASTGLRAVARFENRDNSDYWALGANYALVLYAENADYNFAFAGNGNGMLNGVIQGYAVQSITTQANKITVPSYQSGNTIMVTCNASNAGMTFPTLYYLQKSLDSSSKPFAVNITYIATVDSTQSYYVYGRNGEIKDSNNNYWMSTTQYPIMYNENGGQITSYEMTKGDVASWILTYDGTNYRAYRKCWSN